MESAKPSSAHTRGVVGGAGSTNYWSLFLLHIFSNCCVVYYFEVSFSVAWEGELLLANMSTAISISLCGMPTRLCQQNASSSLHSLVSTVVVVPGTHYRTTETPKWFNTIPLFHIRGYAGTSTVYPKQYPDLAVSANPCQLLTYETPFPRPPHYCGCTLYTHQTSTFLLAV